MKFIVLSLDYLFAESIIMFNLRKNPAYLYDISIIIGSYIFGRYMGRLLNSFINGFTEGHISALPAFAQYFYLFAAVAFVIGLLLYREPLKRSVAPSAITDRDYAALMFTCAWAGLIITSIILSVIYKNTEPSPVAITVTFLVSCGLVFLLFYQAMSIAGKKYSTGEHDIYYKIFLISGLLLMFPLIIGALAPVDSMLIGMNPRFDQTPPSGFANLMLVISMRAALGSFIGWGMVYLIRKLASLPFGSRLSGWPFFVGLWFSYTIKLLQLYMNKW